MASCSPKLAQCPPRIAWRRRRARDGLRRGGPGGASGAGRSPQARPDRVPWVTAGNDSQPTAPGKATTIGTFREPRGMRSSLGSGHARPGPDVRHRWAWYPRAVWVEVDIRPGLPSFTIVGLGDTCAGAGVAGPDPGGDSQLRLRVRLERINRQPRPGLPAQAVRADARFWALMRAGRQRRDTRGRPGWLCRVRRSPRWAASCASCGSAWPSRRASERPAAVA